MKLGSWGITFTMSMIAECDVTGQSYDIGGEINDNDTDDYI